MSQAHYTKDENEDRRDLADCLQSLEIVVEQSSKTLQVLEKFPLETRQAGSQELRELIEEAEKVAEGMRDTLKQQQSLKNRRQRNHEQGQETSVEYREEMQFHAAGLEAFSSDENPATNGCIANYHIIHEGDIKKDEEAICYLAQHEPDRLQQASEGFRVLYNISISEYDNFQIATAPPEVINALNKKSDMNHFHFSITERKPELKNYIINICDSIINRWKTYISSSSKDRLMTENMHNQNKNQNRCLEQEISDMF
ncbi:hypothetical protein DPV78_004277 [Talaromyces pinophilus]|nr:hypothetical protein DPV78_004277 [Talaromyces pinophilus]